jgi:hypothetical protein
VLCGVRRIEAFLGLDLGCQGAKATQFTFDTVVGRKPQPMWNLNSESITRLTSEDILKIYEEAAEMLDHFEYTATTKTSHER